MNNTVAFQLLAGVVSCGLCLILLNVFIQLAPRARLVDVPQGRKWHSKATPLVGGIAVYLAVVATLTAFGGGISWSLAIWFGLVLCLGVIDDRTDLSYRIRVFCHLVIVCGIAFTDSLVVNNIGAIFGGTDIVFFGPVAIAFTAFAVVGAINSLNMIDGLDGLLGSLSLVSVAAVWLFVSLSENHYSVSLMPISIAVIMGALVGFLVLNSRIFYFESARVFLGDAGSTLIGFFLVYLLIEYSQGSNATFSPVLAGWILGLPLLDASAVITQRVLEGKSPFEPDRRHLHHCLFDSGKSVNYTVLTMLSLHCAMIVSGVVISSLAGGRADAFLFWGFIVLVALRLILYSSRQNSAVPAVVKPDSGNSVEISSRRRFKMKRRDRVA